MDWVTRRPTTDQRNLVTVFTVGLALAAWTHQLGNTRGDIDLPHVALLASVAVVVARPRQLFGLTLLGVTVLWTVWDEAPQLSNHWTLVGLIAVALLAVAAVAAAVGRGRSCSERGDIADWYLVTWFIPTARWIFLAFYLFAGFAKVNSAFLDPAVSCAVVFLDESLTSIGLGGLGVQDASSVQWAVMVGTMVIELAIPWLLMIRRTRVPAVFLAIAFHAALSIDRTHQIVDFSSLLTVIYLSFLPAGAFTRMMDQARRLQTRVGDMLTVRPGLQRAVALTFIVGTGLAGEVSFPAFTSSRTLLWWMWQPTVVAVLVALARYVRHQPDGGATPLGAPPAWLMVVPALAVVNGFLPYLEVRSAGSWNMYANLRVVDGESNHLIFRRGIPLTDEYRDLVIIEASSDPGLEAYALQGLAVPRVQLRQYVVDHPDVAITYRFRGETFDSPRAGDDPLLNQPVSVWREKFQVFRAVTIDPPEQCLPTWGVAR